MARYKKKSEDRPVVDPTFSLVETIFDTDGAARYLRISKAYLYLLIKRGELRTFKQGVRTMLTGAAIADYVNKLTAARP
jgi:excisionase family DNA binding protein